MRRTGQPHPPEPRRPGTAPAGFTATFKGVRPPAGTPAYSMIPGSRPPPDPGSPGVRRHPAGSPAIPEPGPRARRHPGVPAGLPFTPLRRDPRSTPPPGGRSPCGRHDGRGRQRTTAIQEDPVGGMSARFRNELRCINMQPDQPLTDGVRSAQPQPTRRRPLARTRRRVCRAAQTARPCLHGEILPWMTSRRGSERGALDRDASLRSRWGRWDSADLPEQAQGVPVDPFFNELAVDDMAEQLSVHVERLASGRDALQFPAVDPAQ